jgi:hypothetical protein
LPKPYVFICHRWDYNEDYYKLVDGFKQFGFSIVNYSVPKHDPLEWMGVRGTRRQLAEQVRQCNYFIVIGRQAIDTAWCRHEVAQAVSYRKPILAVKPKTYAGNVPRFIHDAQNQGGVIVFNRPLIISKICVQLNLPDKGE